MSLVSIICIIFYTNIFVKKISLFKDILYYIQIFYTYLNENSTLYFSKGYDGCRSSLTTKPAYAKGYGVAKPDIARGCGEKKPAFALR